MVPLILVEVPLLFLVGVRNDHLDIIIDFDIMSPLDALQLIRILTLEQAHLNLWWQVKLSYLIRVELDWLLLKDGLSHTRPEVLPTGLHLGVFDRTSLNTPLYDEFVDHLLAIERHVPLRVALVAITTVAFLIEHLFKVVVEVLVKNRPAIPLIFKG